MLKDRLEIKKGGKVDSREVVEVFAIKVWERSWKISTSKYRISKVNGRKERQGENTYEEGCPKAFFLS